MMGQFTEPVSQQPKLIFLYALQGETDTEGNSKQALNLEFIQCTFLMKNEGRLFFGLSSVLSLAFIGFFSV